MSQQTWRAAKRAAGICGTCGTNPPQQDRKQCAACSQKKRELRADYKRRGLCASCGQAKDNPKLSTCAKCRATNAIRNPTRKAQGLCIKCGKQPSMVGETACEPCKLLRSQTFKKRYYKAEADGVCRQCLGPVPEGRASCDKCLEAKKRCNRKVKDEVFEAYGGYICACCGITEPMFLQIDHIERDGYKLRKEQGVGGSLYQWLKRHSFPTGYQVLCANCNWARARRDNPTGMCPHLSARQELTATSPSSARLNHAA